MAEEYDATRDAPTEQEVAAMALSLEGCTMSWTSAWDRAIRHADL